MGAHAQCGYRDVPPLPDASLHTRPAPSLGRAGAPALELLLLRVDRGRRLQIRLGDLLSA
jgi:hypothetical protein